MSLTTGIQGAQQLHTDNRGATLVSFELTLEADDPELSDEARRWCESISDTAGGKFLLTLKHRWGKVRVVGCNLLGETAEHAKVYEVVDGGAAANTVRIATLVESTDTLAIADPAAARTLHLTLYLSTHVDRL